MKIPLIITSKKITHFRKIQKFDNIQTALTYKHWDISQQISMDNIKSTQDKQ